MGEFEELLGVNVWTALFVLLNTLLVFFVARKFLFKPVMKIIEDRQKEIDDIYDEADAVKNEAETMQQEYQKKLSDAQKARDRIVKEAVARGRSREEEIISKANTEAEAILNKAEADIAQEKKKAINEAKDEISDLADYRRKIRLRHDCHGAFSSGPLLQGQCQGKGRCGCRCPAAL